MKTILQTSLLLGFLLFISNGMHSQIESNAEQCVPCEQLLKVRLPDVLILEAKETAEGHCRVLGRISREINFELLLPKKWNQRFLMGGGGGFVGSIVNNFRYSVDQGFATVGTDTGHKGSSSQANWALNNMERQLNFGGLAIHRTATVSKAIIGIFYCSDPLFSYFLGGSRGGGHGMIEAQLYPEDFNGIVVIAPAYNWTAAAAKCVQNMQKIYPDPKNFNYHILTQDNLRLLQSSVLKQCDALDRLNDSIIYDPRDCKFDFTLLPVCPDNQSKPTCFTAQQIDAIKTINSPLIIQKDTVYPGFPLGAENEKNSWDTKIAGSDTSLKTPSGQYVIGTETFKYLVFNDPLWDYTKYDFLTYFKDTKYAASYLNATSTDYINFKSKGGKMIMVHGWNDPIISPYSTIDHYEDIEQRDSDIRSYIRLFMLPGVLHGYGGPGPDQADWINLITNWVEKNEAPERIVVSKIKGKKIYVLGLQTTNNNISTIMTRPVYPFPKEVVYDGKGDPKVESSFLLKTEK